MPSTKAKLLGTRSRKGLVLQEIWKWNDKEIQEEVLRKIWNWLLDTRVKRHLIFCIRALKYLFIEIISAPPIRPRTARTSCRHSGNLCSTSTASPRCTRWTHTGGPPTSSARPAASPSDTYSSLSTLRWIIWIILINIFFVILLLLSRGLIDINIS